MPLIFEELERYRRNAVMAQEQADKATNEHDREAWLRLKRDRLALIPEKFRKPEDNARGVEPHDK